jgi:alkylated DNA repair protein alkB family protein 7
VGFRETERRQWNPVNSAVMARIRSQSFDPTHRLLPHVHVLDLASDGHIKPHVDSVRVRITEPIF